MQETELIQRAIARRVLDACRQLVTESLIGFACRPEPITVNQVDDAILTLGKVQLLHWHRAIEQATACALTCEHPITAVFAAIAVAALHLSVEVRGVARTKQAIPDFFTVTLHIRVIS